MTTSLHGVFFWQCISEHDPQPSSSSSPVSSSLPLFSSSLYQKHRLTHMDTKAVQYHHLTHTHRHTITHAHTHHHCHLTSLQPNPAHQLLQQGSPFNCPFQHGTIGHLPSPPFRLGSSLASSPPHSAPCVTLCPLRPLQMGAHDQKMKQGASASGGRGENESEYVCVFETERDTAGERERD